MCKIIRGFIAVNGQGLDTHMYLPYSESFLIILSPFSSFSCYQAPCIKIIREIIAVNGQGLDTYMYLPYSQSFLDRFFSHIFPCKIDC